MEAQYQQDYEEIQCIGRGNFGAAYLVKHKTEHKDYIAKKIVLGQLESKEQEAAMLEVNLLKNLQHPNIVSYKGSYISQGLMIIVMEYCDVGDLSFHIKRKLQKGEKFTETEIFNWFVQLCLSLEYIHNRKVLHRDIKTQNIFLTGNNTVKLGDFGISKVLENTGAEARTVVGTPYYLSPEVCQNQPYTFKSDVWALGCVLYELCTLKHAFSADNLLGLVYKIVQDKYEPIPSCYSTDLQNLINALLNKNAHERPSVAQILQMPIVRAKMQEFVSTGGKTITDSTPIYVKNTPIVIAPAHAVPSPEDYSKMTPKERMQKKKEEETRKKIEEAKLAARDAAVNYQKAQDMKYNQFYASAKGQTMNLNGTVVHNPSAVAQPHLEQTAFHITQKSQATTDRLDASSNSFDANDRTFELSQSLGTQISYISDYSTTQNRYNSPAAYNDDRAITGKGEYDLGQTRSEYEFEQDFEEVVPAKKDKNLLNEVMDNYKRILDGDIQVAEDSPKKGENSAEVAHRVQVVGNSKMIIMQALGSELFNQVYEFLKYHRRRGTEEAAMYGELKYMVGGNRVLMNHCFNLDGIVFMELMQ